MATQFQMLDIMNAALISQGFEEIVSTNDGSDEQRLLSRNWPTIVEAELEDGAYHFTRKQVFLSSRQDGMFGFADAYVVPAAALHIRRLWTEDADNVRTLPEWAQDGQRVFVNETGGVYIEYVEVADTSFWSANFSRGVQMMLEAVLLGFKEESAEAQMKERQGLNYFERARTNSSKGRSAKEPFNRGSIARSRFRRG